MGLEPTRSCDHRHLKPARLPIPPLLHIHFSLFSAAVPLNKMYHTSIGIKSQHFFLKNFKKIFFRGCQSVLS